MKNTKYIKCFSEIKASELIDIGFEFLYEQNGTWYFVDEPALSKSVKFSNGNNFSDSDVVFTKCLNF